MNLVVDVQCASIEPVPEADDIRRWVAAVLANQRRSGDTEVSVRLVDTNEMSKLNLSYRGKTGPTNVLSFAADLPTDLDLPLLGDIVICAPVVRAEAAEQAKTPAAHWAHMTIHGALHLLGYDHTEEDEAIVMEALESAILASLDYPCPYRANPTQESASA
jgi:probable rRNA maturation factor